MSLRTLRAVAGRALALSVAGLVVVLLGLTVVVPRIAGATSYTILTGSMAPTMPPGTVAVMRPAPIDQISAGDVITYQIRSGEPTVATHRVVAVSTSLVGEVTFTTRGDANDAADPAVVIPEQVRGKLWYGVPYVGMPSLWVGVGTRQLVVTASVVLLLGYALACFVGALRDRRSARQTRLAPVEPALEGQLVGADR